MRLIMLLIGLFYFTISSKAQNDSTMNWTPIINAIIQVESGGDPNAVGGNSAGILQITPICVRQCNNILRERGSSKRYTLDDRFNIEKSIEMFILTQEYFNKECNLEKAIRLWNGGPNYSIKATQKYLNKVMRCYNQKLDENTNRQV